MAILTKLWAGDVRRGSVFHNCNSHCRGFNYQIFIQKKRRDKGTYFAFPDWSGFSLSRWLRCFDSLNNYFSTALNNINRAVIADILE
jgi:hypothetical protein